MCQTRIIVQMTGIHFSVLLFKGLIPFDVVQSNVQFNYTDTVDWKVSSFVPKKGKKNFCLPACWRSCRQLRISSLGWSIFVHRIKHRHWEVLWRITLHVHKRISKVFHFMGRATIYYLEPRDIYKGECQVHSTWRLTVALSAHVWLNRFMLCWMAESWLLHYLVIMWQATRKVFHSDICSVAILGHNTLKYKKVTCAFSFIKYGLWIGSEEDPGTWPYILLVYVCLWHIKTHLL